MKKIGFMIVYNDADYVGPVIDSVKDWLDELIIVEGALQVTIKCGYPERSNDGTLEVLKQYENNPKITVLHRNEYEHIQQYDVGYQLAIEKGADWAVMIDSDEVWTKAAHQKADAFMKKFVNEEAMIMRIQEWVFINDFKTWYPGEYFRFFKANPGSKFVDGNEVQFAGRQRGDFKRFVIPGKCIYHYSYVRRKWRWDMKYAYMKEKKPSLVNGYRLEGDSYHLPSDIPIYEFTGEHPESMKNHPFASMTAHEIIYGEEK